VTVRVLLIDDEDDARATLADRLRRSRSIELVGAVRDGREAARALTNAEPDVLLVDLHSRQGEGDGAELCGELRSMACAPLVVLTSFMTGERWQRLRAAGVTRCLLKLVDSGRLERELMLVGTTCRSGSAAPQLGKKQAQ
jgi:DNA-binding NarL/FixJ family response regulator